MWRPSGPRGREPRLYGFLTREERQAFVTLQGVQGVGPKAALWVLDVLPPAELASAVAREDKAAVGRANGVGPKLAQRIVAELKDKPLARRRSIEPFPPARAARRRRPPPATAVAALMGLGIAETRRPPRGGSGGPAAGRGRPPSGALIKAALQELGQ